MNFREKLEEFKKSNLDLYDNANNPKLKSAIEEYLQTR